MICLRWLVAAVAAAVLAGCGGGGSGADAVDDRAVPDSALRSPEAFTRFVAAQRPDDVREPIDVARVTAPTSETAEPIDVD